MLGWLLVAAAALALFAGLCASADTALLRISRAGAKELATSASEASAPLQAVLGEVPKYVAVLLLARVAAELGATVLVTAVLRSWVGPGWRAYVITVAVMTVVIYVVAGIVPRTLGREYAAGVAGAAASVMQPVVRLLGPLPALLLAIGRVLGRGGRERNGPSGEEEDLRGLVDLLERRRVIEPGERAMIHSVFELGDTIVREVMVPRTDMVFVEQDKTLRQALSLALRSGFSRIPVVGENLDDVVGIAYLKDIVTRNYEHREGEAVEAVASIMRPATFVPDSKPIDDLLREMQAAQIHVAIVIDEYGGTAGLATIEDILEEIVGEIADEYDRELPPVEWLGDSHARVTARLSVDELAELFGVRIEAEDVETVGGLLAQRLGRVPIAGSTATVAGLRLTAESLAGLRNRIGTVTVQRAKESDPADETPADRPDHDQAGDAEDDDQAMDSAPAADDQPWNSAGAGDDQATRRGHARNGRGNPGPAVGDRPARCLRAARPLTVSGRSKLGRVSEAQLGPEDLKIITLARSARARVGSAEGAAVRDETGRTYAAAAVALPSLRLSALALAVAMAVSSGATSLEAAALVTDGDQRDPADIAAVRDIGASAVIIYAGSDGSVRAMLHP